MPRLRASTRFPRTVIGKGDDRMMVWKRDPDTLGAPPVRFHSADPDPYRRYWLERFSPAELAKLARF